MIKRMRIKIEIKNYKKKLIEGWIEKKINLTKW